MVDLIHLQRHVSMELIARAVGSVEVDGAAGKGQEERVAIVGIGDVEGRMVHERFD